jgi:predicted metal-dependent hydrolase
VYDGRVQLRLPWDVVGAAPRRTRQLVVADTVFPIDIVRHRWARRYIIRITEEGRLKLTIPRGASIDGGLKFAAAERDWISREWCRQRAARTSWTIGARIWYRGERLPIAADAGAIVLGPERIPMAVRTSDYGDAIAAHLRRVAARDLPGRCREWAATCGVTIGRISIRDQKSRWGACSPTGTITLNWRLVQMPPRVADYVMLHELMHVRQPNHSRRFWREVDRVCAWWREAEHWLRRHGRDLM